MADTGKNQWLSEAMKLLLHATACLIGTANDSVRLCAINQAPGYPEPPVASSQRKISPYGLCHTSESKSRICVLIVLHLCEAKENHK